MRGVAQDLQDAGLGLYESHIGSGLVATTQMDALSLLVLMSSPIRC